MALDPLKTDVCCVCKFNFKKSSIGQIKTINDLLEAEAVENQLNLKVVVGQRLCDKCRRLVFFGTSKKKITRC